MGATTIKRTESIPATTHRRPKLPPLVISQKSVRMKFCGLQQLPSMSTLYDVAWVPLWTLLEPIQASHNGGVGFLAESTISETTLQRCGYFVPNPTGWHRGQVFDPNLAD